MELFFTDLFGGDYAPNPLPARQALLRAMFVYGAGLLIMRLGKVRLLGRSTMVDVLLAFMIGSILSRAVNGDASISSSLVATAAMVFFHWILTWLAMKHHRFGKL